MFFFRAGLMAMLALGARAGGVADLVAEGALTGRSSRSLASRMEEHAAEHVVLTRQASATPLSTNGTVNMTTWNSDVNTACMTALSKLSEASNPSGTCTCYNLPVLNMATGTFEADLRLFQISAAKDAFAGIPANQVQVSLNYNGASVSPVSATTAQSKVVQRQTATGNNLKLLQTYMFVGQIDKNRLAAASTNMAVVEALIIPTVTLSAVNSAGQTVSTNVSINEAAFVAGAFSNQVVLSTAAQAQIAVDQVVAGLANRTVAFVLPGVNLLIFPIGLIIASIWFVIGIAVIGFGFFERVSYRETYRRRAAYADKGATLKRI